MARKVCAFALVLAMYVNTAAGQETATPSQAPALVRLSPWVLHSKLTHEIMPKYPKDALDHHLQGDICIDVIVDEDGNVQNAKLADCANCTSTLADAALEAVKSWKYQPTVVGGKPVAVSSWIAFRFQFVIEPSVEILTKSESSTPSREAIRPRKLRLSSGVADANLIHKVQPEYPQEAKADHIQGDVVIQCLIGKDGSIVNSRVVSGHPLLARSALDAVRQWKYRPYSLNGEPVEVETTITIRFHM